MAYRTITVTQENIDGGCRKSAENCAIARAFMAQGYKVTAVSPGHVHYTVAGLRRTRELPPMAREFVRVFDGGRPSPAFPNGPEPFEFRIDP